MEKKQPLNEALAELREARALYEVDKKKLLAAIGDFVKQYAKALPAKPMTQRPKRFAASSGRWICSTSSPRVARTWVLA